MERGGCGGSGSGDAKNPGSPRCMEGEMSAEGTQYALEPTTFRSMREAQELTDDLEEALADRNLGSPNVRPGLLEVFSEIVNNAAEHGMAEPGAHAHVRYLPHRRGEAFDVVVADEGPGIQATLANNPHLDVPESDSQAIEKATRELVSGTGDPTRGLGLWMTVTEMRKPGRKLLIHSGAGPLTMYGTNEPEFREMEHGQGTMVGLTIPV